MSDGIGETAKDRENSNAVKKKSELDSYSHAISRISVAQICESSGFQGFQRSALDAFSDVAVRYIHEIGRIANSRANLAGRNQCNVFDVVQGLDDLGSIQGFQGASSVSNCLLYSGTIRDIMQYVGGAEEIPFVQFVSSFPVSRERKVNPSFIQSGVSPPSEHIPAWLPAFPPPESYSDSVSANKRETEASHELKVEQTAEKRKVERSFQNFQQPLTCNGSELPAPAYTGDDHKARGAVEHNPFLAAPLRFGKMEVSPVVLPAKFPDEAKVHHQDHTVFEDHVTVPETFKSSIDAAKSSQFDDEQKNILRDGRPTVQFKFGSRRKSLERAVVLNSKGDDMFAYWFNDD